MYPEEFEWDPEKNIGNQEKHGFSFEEAAEVFKDANRLELEDDRGNYGETRFLTLGEVHGHVLIVVYTWRAGHRRIISARKANSRERKAYYLHPGRD